MRGRKERMGKQGEEVLFSSQMRQSDYGFDCGEELKNEKLYLTFLQAHILSQIRHL